MKEKLTLALVGGLVIAVVCFLGGQARAGSDASSTSLGSNGQQQHRTLWGCERATTSQCLVCCQEWGQELLESCIGLWGLDEQDCWSLFQRVVGGCQSVSCGSS